MRGVFILGCICALVLKVRAEQELPRLHGTLLGGGERLASIVEPGAARGTWVSEGQLVGGYRLIKIEKEKALLCDNKGEFAEIFLIGAKVIEPKIGSLVPFSRKWINSRANPMLLQPQEISARIARAWQSMTTSERSEIEEFYRKHGWRMVRAELLSGGALTVEWENIFEKERTARVQENRAAFVNSLSGEQKILWDQLAKTQPRVRVGESFTDEQLREIERMKQLSDQFRSTLSVQQELERSTIQDFTKGDW